MREALERVFKTLACQDVRVGPAKFWKLSLEWGSSRLLLMLVMSSNVCHGPDAQGEVAADFLQRTSRWS